MNGLSWGSLCLLLCALRLVRAPRPIVLAALLCAVGKFVLIVPIWWPALQFGLKYNWTGKLFSILVSLLVVYGGKWVSPLETGLVRPLPGLLRAVGPVVMGLAAVQLASVLITQGYGPSRVWESFRYQLTMPGIAEELFSGVLCWVCWAGRSRATCRFWARAPVEAVWLACCFSCWRTASLPAPARCKWCRRYSFGPDK